MPGRGTWYESKFRKMKRSRSGILSGEKSISIPIFWTTRFCWKRMECQPTIWRLSLTIFWWRSLMLFAAKSGCQVHPFICCCGNTSAGKNTCLNGLTCHSFLDQMVNWANATHWNMASRFLLWTGKIQCQVNWWKAFGKKDFCQRLLLIFLHCLGGMTELSRKFLQGNNWSKNFRSNGSIVAERNSIMRKPSGSIMNGSSDWILKILDCKLKGFFLMWCWTPPLNCHCKK